VRLRLAAALLRFAICPAATACSSSLTGAAAPEDSGAEPAFPIIPARNIAALPGISFSVFGWPLYCLKIYTGITRGKRLLVLIGQKKALGIAVRNDRPQRRSGGIPGFSPV
jgi:hypothetical protein